MGTNRRKAVKEKFERVAKDRRIKARRERKQARKVADRLLGIRKAPKPKAFDWEWHHNNTQAYCKDHAPKR